MPKWKPEQRARMEKFWAERRAATKQRKLREARMRAVAKTTKKAAGNLVRSMEKVVQRANGQQKQNGHAHTNGNGTVQTGLGQEMLRAVEAKELVDTIGWDLARHLAVTIREGA